MESVVKKREDILKLRISTIELYKELFGRKKLKAYRYVLKKIPSSEHTLQTVGRINSLKIEVRSSEKPHNLPHFHVTSPGRVNAVYTISPTIEFYKGAVTSKDNKAILNWAEQNREILVNMWNDYHGYRIKAS